MEKFWTQFYPAGVPAEIEPSSYKSLIDYFDAKLALHANQVFSTNVGVSVTYAQVDAYARAFSAWLQSQNIPKDTSIAMMMPNVQQYLPVLIGIIRAGYSLTTVNPLYTTRELKHQMNDTQSQVIVILENFCPTLAEVIDETPIKTVVVAKVGDLLGEIKGFGINLLLKHVKKAIPDCHFSNRYQVIDYKTVLANGKRLTYTPVTAHIDDVVFLQYTGGTTGVAKGLMISHGNILTATQQFGHWFSPGYRKIPQHIQPNVILALPLYHIFAFIVSMLAIEYGQALTLITNPRDVNGFIKTLKAKPFHVFPGVNTLFQALLNDPEFAKVDCSQLTISIAGGMATTPHTAQQWLRTTGCPLIEAWGMSETLAAGTANVVTNPIFTGNIGLPLPSIEISIRDDVGSEVGIGETGEICIKGGNVIKGYRNLDNSKYFTPDGYLITGDVGFIDDKGQVKLLDRKKDMLIISGFNVYPTEIEAILLEHEMVAECAVIGVADDKQGEAIKAFIVKADPSLTAEMLKEFSQKHLTGYKRPRQYEFIDQLPKTAVGKIQKNLLREQTTA